MTHSEDTSPRHPSGPGWTPERYQRFADLFRDLVDQPVEVRMARVDAECADDPDLKKALVDAFQIDAAAPPTDLNVTRAIEAIRPTAPTRLGRYRILSEIGDGGFGIVYLAEQTEPVRRRVAIKVIKPGMDSRAVIARFEAERQALALMNHPGIAKILDADATDLGLPYFVMEYVKGEAITKYCDRLSLTIPRRLELFAEICDAVHHAHQKGVIHRDIKPSNVLVADSDGDAPQAKVIDFGIAKAISQPFTDATILTGAGQIIGTLDYMSPEQAAMFGMPDIDTRSDVYSLGVLLYELLTGSLPFDLRTTVIDESLRVIREDDPPRPSTKLSTLGAHADRIARQRKSDKSGLTRQLRGELEWIPLKALRKDRTKRYQSASELGEDVRRYLRGDALHAGPLSTTYRVRKFVRRHRVFVGAATVTGAALVVATALSLTFALIADGQRTRALAALEDRDDALQARDAALVTEKEQRKAAEKARAAAVLAGDFQAEQLSSIDVPIMATRLRADLLERARDAGERAGLSEQEIEQRVADLEASIVDLDFAGMAVESIEVNILDRALESIDRQFADEPVIQARLIQSVATTLLSLGRPDRAEEPQAAALAIRRAELGDEDPATLRSLAETGVLLAAQGKYAEAEKVHKEALEAMRRRLGEDHPDTLNQMVNIADVVSDQGRYDEARRLYDEALASMRRVIPEDDERIIVVTNNIGSLLYEQGHLQESLDHHREAQKISAHALGADHPQTLQVAGSVGTVLWSLGRYDEAEEIYSDVTATMRRVLGNNHPETLTMIGNMGVLHESLGKYDSAERFYLEALTTSRRLLGDDHPDTLATINNLGALLNSQGRYAEAEPFYREAVDGRRRRLGDEHQGTLLSMSNLAGFLHTSGQTDEAVAYAREILETQRRVLGNDHPETLISVNNLGYYLRKNGELEEAEVYLREGLEGSRRVLGNEHPDTLLSMTNVAGLLTEQERYEEAEPYHREALEISRRTIGDDHPDTLRYLNNIGFFYGAQERFEEAEPYYREAAEGAVRSLGPDHFYAGVFHLNHGRALYAMGRLHEAETAFIKAHANLVVSMGPDHGRTRRAIESLIDTYTDLHAEDPGAGHDASAEAWRTRLPAED